MDVVEVQTTDVLLPTVRVPIVSRLPQTLARLGRSQNVALPTAPPAALRPGDYYKNFELHERFKPKVGVNPYYGNEALLQDRRFSVSTQPTRNTKIGVDFGSLGMTGDDDSPFPDLTLFDGVLYSAFALLVYKTATAKAGPSLTSVLSVFLAGGGLYYRAKSKAKSAAAASAQAGA